MAIDRTMVLSVQGNEIALERAKLADYLNLTDIARSRETEHAAELVRDWLNDRNTVKFLGLWETLQNPRFDTGAFEAIRAKIGSNGYSLSPRQWILRTGAVGLLLRSGKRSGLYAHPEIAFEFASWLSVEFKLYLTREFQRLRREADEARATNWQRNRAFAKISNRLHAQAVRAHLISPSMSREEAAEIYRSEADMLNIALFGMTAREWREAHPDFPGNMRDYASMEQLLVLVDLQTVDAELIRLGISQPERLLRLNELAIRQLRALSEVSTHPKPIPIGPNPEPPAPARVQLRIIEFPVQAGESGALAA